MKQDWFITQPTKFQNYKPIQESNDNGDSNDDDGGGDDDDDDDNPYVI
jgi:hypothetical protein